MTIPVPASNARSPAATSAPVRARRTAFSLAALAFFADGMGTQAMGLAVPSLLRDWSITRGALAMPTALGLAGFALGALAGGLGGDRYGRRASLSISLLLLGGCTAACALARDPLQLGLLRLLAGLGLGASLPVAATVIAESARPAARSIAIAVGLAFLPLGGFAAGLAASVILPQLGWKGLFAATGCVAVACAPFVAAASGISAAAERRDAHVRLSSALARAFDPGHRRDTLALAAAFFFTVLDYYSVFSWAPAALSAQGIPIGAASRAMSGFSVGGLVGGLLAGTLVQRFGSRTSLWLLAVGAVASALFLPALASAAHGSGATLIAGLAALGLSVIGIQTLLYALGAHVYDASRRATGIGIAVGAGRLGAIASAFTGVFALDLGGFYEFCGSIALACVLALLCGLLVTRQIARLQP